MTISTRAPALAPRTAARASCSRTSTRFFSAFSKIRKHYHTIELTSGALLVIIGILIFTNRFTIIARTLQPYLPVY